MWARNDVTLEDRKKYLRRLLSVLFQLCEQSNSYCDIFSDFYSHGAQNPSDDALVSCFQEILNLPRQAPIFLILDALDECSSTFKFSMPSSRENALALVLMKQLIKSKQIFAYV